LPNHNELVGLMGIVGKEFPAVAERIEYCGNQANEASWRRVLSTGKILSPVGPALRLPPRSPARVYGG